MIRASKVPPFIVSLGEVLWDEFPDGTRLAGAPAYFAIHCVSMGARAALVSRVGLDSLGRETLRILMDRGVIVNFVQRDTERPTGRVKVTLNEGKPKYEIMEGAAWDAICWNHRFASLLGRAGIAYFGTIGQRSETSRETLQRFLTRLGNNCLKILDLNFRQRYHSGEVVGISLHLADILKLSDEEIPILRDYLGGPKEASAFLLQVRERFHIETIALTLGAHGCRILGSEDDIKVPATSQKVVNTVGAGDAFIAAYVLNQLAGKDIRTSAEQANRAGGYIVSQDSATLPTLSKDFRVF